MRCGYCKEEINDQATRCKHCGGEFLFCPRCKRNVVVETKSKFVGLVRGGTKDVKKCVHCGKILYGPKCYVVTATYGENSRQAALVHARCRRRFLLNPPLTMGWCVYRYYGPILARWSQASQIGFRLCKVLLADPIVCATGRSHLVSAFCMLYLTMLSFLGLLFLVPCIAVRLAMRPFVSAAPNQPLEPTEGRDGSLRNTPVSRADLGD